MRIFTDGSCRQGMGGWGWWNEETGKSDSGFSPGTTNQRMELQAALEAIDSHLDQKGLTIVSDSAYLVNGFLDKWYLAWERNKWVGTQGKPIANRDIWEKLLALVRENGSVTFEWTKGHAGNPGNEKADMLANDASFELWRRWKDEQITAAQGEQGGEGDRIHRRSGEAAGVSPDAMAKALAALYPNAVDARTTDRRLPSP